MALLHEELTYQIRGLCYQIQKEYGGGQKEKLYHRALVEKITIEKTPFEHEPKLTVHCCEIIRLIHTGKYGTHGRGTE